MPISKFFPIIIALISKKLILNHLLDFYTKPYTFHIDISVNIDMMIHHKSIQGILYHGSIENI